MNTPTPEQLAKLPAWARDYIKNLSMQREQAIKTLNEFCDSQTPTPFYIEDNPCTGEQSGPSTKRHYINAISINVFWRNVWLRVDANDYGNSGDGIRLQWGSGNPDNRQGEAAFIPGSYQYARLVSKEDMR